LSQHKSTNYDEEISMMIVIKRLYPLVYLLLMDVDRRRVVPAPVVDDNEYNNKRASLTGGEFDTIQDLVDSLGRLLSNPDTHSRHSEWSISLYYDAVTRYTIAIAKMFNGERGINYQIYKRMRKLNEYIVHVATSADRTAPE
jgi:hypothetical protein